MKSLYDNMKLQIRWSMRERKRIQEIIKAHSLLLQPKWLTDSCRFPGVSSPVSLVTCCFSFSNHRLDSLTTLLMTCLKHGMPLETSEIKLSFWGPTTPTGKASKGYERLPSPPPPPPTIILPRETRWPQQYHYLRNRLLLHHLLLILFRHTASNGCFLTDLLSNHVMLIVINCYSSFLDLIVNKIVMKKTKYSLLVVVFLWNFL